jgi:hypothetical protein
LCFDDSERVFVIDCGTACGVGVLLFVWYCVVSLFDVVWSELIVSVYDTS